MQKSIIYSFFFVWTVKKIISILLYFLLVTWIAVKIIIIHNMDQSKN